MPVLLASALVIMGESHVGLVASSSTHGNHEQRQHVRAALGLFERAREGTLGHSHLSRHFIDDRAVYVKLGDKAGTLDTLAMTIRLAEWSGDEETAAVADSLYAQHLETAAAT
jgi:hypothetical protein